MSGFELPELQGWSEAVKLPGAPRLVGEGKEAGAAAGGGFAGQLAEAIGEVDALQDDLQGKLEALAMGEPVELHDVMLAMGKSEVAFNLMLEVRNKLVDAWEKLSRSVT